MDRIAAQSLAGTEGATYPFWAPDGRALGFFADGKLKRIPLDGGTPQILADAPSGRGAAWNRDGVIVFAPTTASSLMRIPATGGTPVAVTRFGANQISHRWPQFLPDGRRFLFASVQRRPGSQGVFLGALDGAEAKRVLEDESPAAYAPPGTLLLVRRGVLLALPFDATAGVVGGEGVPVAPSVGFDGGLVRGAFSVSENGVLAHRTRVAERRRLMWVDRTGAVQGAVGPDDDYGVSGPELTREGRYLAMFRSVDGNTDIWLMPTGSGVPSRFTFNERLDHFPVWSADGRRVIFASNRNNTHDLYERLASGAADEQALWISAEGKLPMSVSPDGRFVLYSTQVPKTGVDLWALPLAGDRTPFPVVKTDFDEMAGQISPDGAFIAYQSNASGRMEIYLGRFPRPGGQWQVSPAGGTQPRWAPDGKEIFYVAPDGRLMAIPITIEPDDQTPIAGTPIPLFTTRLASGVNVYPAIGTKPQYAVAPNGRFLMNVPVEGTTAPPITVVLNK